MSVYHKISERQSEMGVIYRYNGMENGELRWQGVPVRAYGPENSSADRATRQILIGTGENSPNFHMRYFAVQPGGYTSLDQHPHDHGVYVPGNEVHQFFTLGQEPFGFLCVVPAKR